MGRGVLKMLCFLYDNRQSCTEFVQTIKFSSHPYSPMSSGERTTITVDKETHRRLERLKPYESVSFNDLLTDMVDSYEGSSDD